MQSENKEKRERNIAFQWSDKRILRFFRRTFTRKDYKKLRNTYLALSEIDSDFVEQRESETKSIRNLTKTCATYAGMDEGEIGICLQALRTLGLIEYGRKRNKKTGQTIGSYLTLYKWEGEPIPGDTHIRESSNKGISGSIKNTIINNSKEGIMNNLKRLNFNLNSLRNEFKKAKPSTSPPLPSGRRLHRRNNLKDPYLNGIIAKCEKEITNSTYKKAALKQNRSIPTALDSSNNDVKDVVRLWNSSGKPFTCHKPDSKVTERAVRQIQRHLTSHSLEDIKCSLRQYFELVSSSDTSIRPGIPGHVVGLDEFFGFSKLTRERMLKQKVKLGIKSWFDECLPDKDPVAKYVSEAHSIPDTHPQVTGKFKRIFIKKVLGGISGKFTPREENNFKRAAMKMISFLKINNGILLLDPDERRNPLLFVPYVFEAIEHQTNGDFSRVTPGWFSTDSLYTRTLPSYLHEQAMVRDSEF